MSNQHNVSLFLQHALQAVYHSRLFDRLRSVECLDLLEAAEGDLDLKPQWQIPDDINIRMIMNHSTLHECAANTTRLNCEDNIQIQMVYLVLQH